VRRRDWRRLRRRIYGSAAVALGVFDLLGCVLVGLGHAHYPLWVQIGNAATLGALLVALGFDYASGR